LSTKIKLMRLGKMRAPYYRVVVADSRTKRNGRVIETIGKYHPKEDPSFIEVDSERAQYWLKVGAQPTEPVRAILSVTGDWQRFRGEPAPPPMKTAAERPDKKALFDAAAKAAASETAAEDGAKPAKKTVAKKAASTPDPDAKPTPKEDSMPAEGRADGPTEGGEAPAASETPTASAVEEAAGTAAEQAADDTAPAGGDSTASES
jgi:small subunit ribosomal protein S16